MWAAAAKAPNRYPQELSAYIAAVSGAMRRRITFEEQEIACRSLGRAGRHSGALPVARGHALPVAAGSSHG